MKHQENPIEIVPSPRPEDDGPEAWRRMIANQLGIDDIDFARSRRLDFLNDIFVECDTCAAKPGSPTLCTGCLANRNTIGRLRERTR